VKREQPGIREVGIWPAPLIVDGAPDAGSLLLFAQERAKPDRHLVGRRLGRDLSGVFGSKKYAYEDMICELSNSFVCAALDIVPTVRHADFIGAWAEIVEADNRAIVRAASAASKAADYLLALLPDSKPDQQGASRATIHEPSGPPPAARAESRGRGPRRRS
jgi:hypothetical protein